MTTLNDAFERELSQEDEGYESGSESLNILTPLRKPSRIYHISTNENISFDPTTVLTTAAQCPEATSRSHSSVWCCLMFDSSDEESASPISSPLHSRTEPSSLACCHMDYQHPSLSDSGNSFQDVTNEEEDFPTVTLMTTFGLKIQLQTDIYVFMNTHNHIFCVPTPVHIAWTHYHTPQKMLQHLTTR